MRPEWKGVSFARAAWSRPTTSSTLRPFSRTSARALAPYLGGPLPDFPRFRETGLKGGSAAADAAVSRAKQGRRFVQLETMATSKAAPLGRSASSDVLDWEGIEQGPRNEPQDVFGLKAEDRLALGMSNARPLDIAPSIGGDASAALVEALAKGAAITAAKKRR